ITNVNGIIDGLANNAVRILIDKASIANQTASRMASLWRATGQPAQAAIPSAPALCNSALLGAISFANRTLPIENYVGWMYATCSNNATSIEVRDRLVHNGGLLLNITTSQAITGLDLATLAVSADRLGSANYSDVEWFLEVYTDGGATASNATINVTYDDNSIGNLNTLAVGGTIRAGNAFALTPLIPTGQQGKFIKGINSVVLSASTGTAGNFGFTATRARTVVELPLANKLEVRDWAALGLPYIPNDSCLMLMTLCSTTSTGNFRGGGKIIYG
ncbi:MAG: hypothetical protein ACRDBG_03435, partial [Waterburya sp.]